MKKNIRITKKNIGDIVLKAQQISAVNGDFKTNHKAYENLIIETYVKFPYLTMKNIIDIIENNWREIYNEVLSNYSSNHFTSLNDIRKGILCGYFENYAENPAKKEKIKDEDILTPKNPLFSEHKMISTIKVEVQEYNNNIDKEVQKYNEQTYFKNLYFKAAVISYLKNQKQFTLKRAKVIYDNSGKNKTDIINNLNDTIDFAKQLLA